MSKRIVKLTESDLVKIIKKVINEQVRREHLDWFKNENFEIEIDGNKSYLEIQNVDSDRNTEDKFYIYTKKMRTGERSGVKIFNDITFCYDCDLKDQIQRYKNGTCLSSESYTNDDIIAGRELMDNLYKYLCLNKPIQ